MFLRFNMPYFVLFYLGLLLADFSMLFLQSVTVAYITVEHQSCFQLYIHTTQYTHTFIRRKVILNRM